MSTRDLVLISLFAAIIAALGLLPPITLGIFPVPITAQSLGVMLAGVILGAKRGVLAIALTILIAAIGLPILSGGRGGLSIFYTPTTGYLIGWLFAVYTTGTIAEKFVSTRQSAFAQFATLFAAATLGGIVVLYAFGISYLAFATGIGFSKAFFGSMAFIPGDLLKAALAALAGRAVLAGYPLLPRRA